MSALRSARQLIRRTLSIAVGAVMVGTTLMVATTPAQALGPGVVCMFNAPTGAPLGQLLLGHVGWAFRVGDTQDWNFGATESESHNWRDSGDLDTMFDTFRGLRGHSVSSDYYTQWRCKDTPDSAVGAASAKVDQLYGQPYERLTNNCLTRSVAIFKTYASSMNSLPNGEDTRPNAYFEDVLTAYGFGPKHPL